MVHAGWRVCLGKLAAATWDKTATGAEARWIEIIAVYFVWSPRASGAERLVAYVFRTKTVMIANAATFSVQSTARTGITVEMRACIGRC